MRTNHLPLEPSVVCGVWLSHCAVCGQSYPSSNAPLNEEISVWLAKVGETVDNLSRRLWNDRGIRVDEDGSILSCRADKSLLCVDARHGLHFGTIRSLVFQLRCMTKIIAHKLARQNNKHRRVGTAWDLKFRSDRGGDESVSLA